MTVLRIVWKKGGDTYGITSAPNGTCLPAGRYLTTTEMRKRLPYKDGNIHSLNFIFFWVPIWNATHDSIVRYTWPDITDIDVLPVPDPPMPFPPNDDWADEYLTPFTIEAPTYSLAGGNEPHTEVREFYRA